MTGAPTAMILVALEVRLWDTNKDKPTYHSDAHYMRNAPCTGRKQKSEPHGRGQASSPPSLAFIEAHSSCYLHPPTKTKATTTRHFATPPPFVETDMHGRAFSCHCGRPCQADVRRRENTDVISLFLSKFRPTVRSSFPRPLMMTILFV